MADVEAMALVTLLRAQGVSYAEMSRALGRDSSLFAQIGRGARSPRYGASMVPALKRLAAGERVTPAAYTRVQRLRTPGVRTNAAGGVMASTANDRTFQQSLARAAARGEQASVIITATHIREYGGKTSGTVNSFQHGYNAGALQLKLYDNGWNGSLEDAGRILAGERGVEVRNVTRITLNTAPRRR